jgi:predicted  nucleic acid-binding Zn-ribbon protein
VQETMRQLVRTRKVDEMIAVIEGELANLPAELAAIEAEIEGARGEIAIEKSELEEAELEERRVENSMRDQEALIERLNHQSAQVSSNQAYTALQHELDAAEAAKTKYETAALEQMETIDRARGCVAVSELKLSGLEDAAPEKSADIDSRKRDRDDDLAKQIELRSREIAGIAPGVMSRYDRIRTRKQPAIAVIDGKSCSECKIVLPRMVISEVMRLKEIHNCTSCKRLLILARELTEND